MEETLCLFPGILPILPIKKKRDDKISRTLVQWFSNKIIIIKAEKNY